MNRQREIEIFSILTKSNKEMNEEIRNATRYTRNFDEHDFLYWKNECETETLHVDHRRPIES